MANMEPLFYFDFGSPNAYLSHRVIPEIEARTGARFKYVPILLGGLFKMTGNQSPMAAFANIPTKLAYQRVEMQRFITKHGLDQIQEQPVLPGQHARLDARRCRGRGRRTFCRPTSNRCTATCGRSRASSMIPPFSPRR